MTANHQNDTHCTHNILRDPTLSKKPDSIVVNAFPFNNLQNFMHPTEYRVRYLAC